MVIGFVLVYGAQTPKAGTWSTDQPSERGRCEATNETKREWSRMMEDRWLSVDEIADHLGIKRDTVYKWISERQMPGHKIGRLWKFNKREVDEWVRTGGANTSHPENETSEARKRES